MSKPFRLKMKQRYLPFVYGYLARFLIGSIGLTYRYRAEGMEKFKETASNNKCLLMFWHNRLIIMNEVLNRFVNFNIAAMVSHSRDGEIISVFTNSYKNRRSIRIPHNAKAIALKNMIREMGKNDEVVVVTPDGPKGPIYEVKPGIAFAAKVVGAAVVPLTWTASRYWQLPTWDKMILPKPFSTITVKVGDPIMLPRKSDKTIEEESKILEEALKALG